jgi:phosphopantothenoylcysteine decarboxylase/phosphopantothenate--cysteine ligase
MVKVVSANEMLNAVSNIFANADITIMSAAVADYTPSEKAAEKIKKETGTLTLELNKTTDILKTLGQKKRAGQVLAGFALETHNEKEYAKAKLESKNLDLIVLNSLRDTGAGFGTDTNQVTVLDRSGKERVVSLRSKKEVADQVISFIIEKYA